MLIQLYNTRKSMVVTTSNNTEYRQDFYKAVNRHWLEDPSNTIPAAYPRWGGFIQLHDMGLKHQIELVKDLCSVLLIDPTKLNASQLKIAATWDASNRHFQ
jgi:predicted metalloendopeptidase